MNWIQRRFHQFDQKIIEKNGWRHLDAAPSFYGVYHQYTGKSIRFDSGTLQQGDWVIELHLDNRKMLEEGLTPPQLFRQIKKEIKGIQSDLPKQYPEAKGCYGVSVFGPLLKRLGFETQPYPNRFQGFWIALWENSIRWVHGSMLKWHAPSVLFLNIGAKKEPSR